ncbi:MAG: hypothetical protein DME00_36320 [Candidatus Rokuibacteriota bacterium]|nr:MAG: hypothetical protein DME00_36320 [Candidatus Rokubacteria bacterium]
MKREAVSLKQELEHQLKVSPKIRWGGPGQLDVLVDGTVIFSKKRAGRMPTSGEILVLVKTRQSRD